MRRWSVGSSTYGPESLPAGNGWSPDGPASVTPELVYELPAVARISQFVVTAGLPAGPPARIDVGVSTANDRDFTPAGTVTLTPQGGAVVNASLAGTFSARWVRVRFTATPGKALQVSSISAFGTLPVPPAKIAGRWSLAENDLGYQDAVFAKVKGMIPNDSPAAAYYQLATAFVQNEFVATTCTYDRAVWRGSADGATASIDGGGALVAVAGGRLLVGRIGADKILARRVARAPGCDVPPVGRGPLVVVLARHPADELDVSDPKLIPGHRFITHLLPEVTPQDLNGASAAVLALSCNVGKDTTAAQQTDLLDFVRRGRVLIVRDADRCSQSAYDFIPYPFETAATGARGARGNVLQIVRLLGPGEQRSAGSRALRRRGRLLEESQSAARRCRRHENRRSALVRFGGGRECRRCYRIRSSLRAARRRPDRLRWLRRSTICVPQFHRRCSSIGLRTAFHPVRTFRAMQRWRRIWSLSHLSAARFRSERRAISALRFGSTIKA